LRATGPLVKLILWITTGALPPVIREGLCLDWTGRITLSPAPQGISRDDQGDPCTSAILSTRMRATLALSPHGYRRADTIANPKLASMKSLNYSVGPTARERLQGSEQHRKGRSNGEVCIWI
jgi:hypothetical protein